MMVAPAISSATNVSLIFYDGLFRSVSKEDKGVVHERITKTININGLVRDSEEIYASFQEIAQVKFVNQLENVVKFINDKATDKIKSQAVPYLEELNSRLSSLVSFNFPKMSASLPDDESVLVEWDFKHFTVGLAFDENPEDSGWYIVNDGQIKGTTGWGYLHSRSVNEVVQQFMDEVWESLNVKKNKQFPT